MNELSLFTGCGGGVLGTKLLGWSTIGYVEQNKFRCERLTQRIDEGYLDSAPVFGCTVAEFIRLGYAAMYQGVVDVITAGFPCQPFSVRGKRAGPADNRNAWPETIECIRVVRPRFVFLENVKGLRIAKDGKPAYFGRVLADLAACGYGVKWDCLPAKLFGADHERDRLWIVGDSMCQRRDTRMLEERKQSDILGTPDLRSDWWGTESGLDRVAHGMADRVDRLRAIGDGQVPAVVRAAWRGLTGT